MLSLSLGSKQFDFCSPKWKRKDESVIEWGERKTARRTPTTKPQTKSPWVIGAPDVPEDFIASWRPRFCWRCEMENLCTLEVSFQFLKVFLFVKDHHCLFLFFVIWNLICCLAFTNSRWWSDEIYPLPSVPLVPRGIHLGPATVEHDHHRALWAPLPQTFLCI